MSHSVTITRTTTTTTGSAFVVSTGYLKSPPGILKILELILGAVCVGLIGHYYRGNIYGFGSSELFFFLMTVTFLIGTFCNLAGCIISLATASLLSKTIYEVIYHAMACILYLAASLTHLTAINKYGNRYYEYEAYMAASIIGLVVAVLYLFSLILGIKSYRGL